jgi:hypothetical protein
MNEISANTENGTRTAPPFASAPTSPAVNPLLLPLPVLRERVGARGLLWPYRTCFRASRLLSNPRRLRLSHCNFRLLCLHLFRISLFELRVSAERRDPSLRSGRPLEAVGCAAYLPTRAALFHTLVFPILNLFRISDFEFRISLPPSIFHSSRVVSTRPVKNPLGINTVGVRSAPTDS